MQNLSELEANPDLAECAEEELCEIVRSVLTEIKEITPQRQGDNFIFRVRIIKPDGMEYEETLSKGVLIRMILRRLKLRSVFRNSK